MYMSMENQLIIAEFFVGISFDRRTRQLVTAGVSSVFWLVVCFYRS